MVPEPGCGNVPLEPVSSCAVSQSGYRNNTFLSLLWSSLLVCVGEGGQRDVLGASHISAISEDGKVCRICSGDSEKVALCLLMGLEGPQCGTLPFLHPRTCFSFCFQEACVWEEPGLWG